MCETADYSFMIDDDFYDGERWFYDFSFYDRTQTSKSIYRGLGIDLILYFIKTLFSTDSASTYLDNKFILRYRVLSFLCPANKTSKNIRKMPFKFISRSGNFDQKRLNIISESF